MGSFNFSVDMHFRWLGREYVVKETLPDSRLRILDIAFNESRGEAYADLVQALYAGELEFLGKTQDTQIQRKQAERFVDDFTMLDDSDPRKLEAKRRLAYVTAVAGANLDRFCAETVNPIIDGVHAKVNDQKPKPHWKTVVYTYLRRWERCNRDIRALGADFQKQGNRSAKIVGAGNRKRKGDSYSTVEKLKAREVDQIIEREIERLLQRGKKVSISEVHESVQLAIVNENQPEAPIDHLPIPSERAIHYEVGRLRPYDRDLLLYGKAYADKKYQSNGPSAEYTRPLERVEYDDTPTDLLVVDETTGLPLGRATETLGIDCYSGMPHGSHTGFDGPGYLAVARALLHGIQPKTYVKQLYPRVESDWPVYGVPQEIGVDNGAGYISADLADACSEIGTTIDYCPPRYPNGKPYIESLNASLAERLHRLDGTTFSNFLEKADYDPEKHAVISFNAWMEIKHVTLVDVIARQLNRRRHNTPLKLWTLGVTNYPPALPRKLHDLRVLLGRIVDGQIAPCNSDPGEKILKDLNFSKRQISKLANRIAANHNGDSVYAAQAARILKLNTGAVISLIKSGLIATQEAHRYSRKGLLISRSTLHDFASSHVRAADLANRLNTNSATIIHLLAAKGIKPITTTRRDNQPQYVFRRKDIKGVDWIQFKTDINARALQSTPGKTFDLTEAATLIGCSQETISVIVENGLLKTTTKRSKQQTQTTDYVFAAHAIKNYLRQFGGRTDVVSGKVAAKILNETTNTFHNRIKSGGLKRFETAAKCGRLCYFLLEDIQAIAVLKNRTITTVETTQLLSVSQQQLSKLAHRGILAPVTGPKIDGCGRNRYLRSAVEDTLNNPAKQIRKRSREPKNKENTTMGLHNTQASGLLHHNSINAGDTKLSTSRRV
jgi:putative transposase